MNRPHKGESIMKPRKSDYPIDKSILTRWSPRAMSPELLDDDQLMSLFEAARWAPSSFNAQLWRFIYAKRGTKHWDMLFNLLDEVNASWAKNASFFGSRSFTRKIYLQ